MGVTGVCVAVDLGRDTVTVTVELPATAFVLGADVAVGERVSLAPVPPRGRLLEPVRASYAHGRDGCGGGRD